MKLILLALCGLACFGQDAKEPDFADVFYRLGDGGKLEALERAHVDTKISMSGFASAKGVMRIEGAHSSVRFPAGKIELVVKPLTDADPAESYHLRMLASGKKDRQVTFVKANAFGGASTKPAGILPVEFSRYREKSLKAVVTLEPGEYSIGRSGSQTAFCFSVQ